MYDGRPVGVIHEGPFSSDSFLFGAYLFGDKHKYRLPASSQEDIASSIALLPKEGNDAGQYCYVEHTLLRAWEGAFPDFNQPFDFPGMIKDEEGALQVAFPADGLFVDQLNLRGCCG